MNPNTFALDVSLERNKFMSDVLPRQNKFRIYWYVICAGIALLVTAATAHAATFDHTHAAFTSVLKPHVYWNAAGTASSVDYGALKANPAPLKAYTATLSQVTMAEFQAFTALQRRAFLINAYNAFTLELILSKYPNLTSIKDLGSLLRSPWKQAFVSLLGATRSLDDIEHTLLRGSKEYNDPRIHFAVNCASIGCPALRPEAFVADQLNAQLLDQTQRFLKDRTRNYYDVGNDTIVLSSIFDWYGDDFEKGHLGAKSIAEFLTGYAASLGLDQKALARLKRNEIDVDYSDYDWKLNEHRAAKSSALNERVEQLFGEIAPSVADVPLVEVASLRASPSSYLLVDARPDNERKISTILGAVTVKQLNKSMLANKKPVVFCTIGYRSAVAARNLRREGFDAHNLRGGILAWIAQGGALIDSNNKPTQTVHVYGASWAVVPSSFTAVF
jgi:rhodanese-related sulfurtransferase